MMIISSRDNKIIKDAAALSQKKYRDSSGLFLIEGPNAVEEAWKQGGRLRFIFTRAGVELPECIAASDAAPVIYELTGDVFDKISQTETSQGIVAVAEKKLCSETAFFKKDGINVLVLDRIQDPGNMGTLLRTAEAMGFGGAILVKGCTDCWAPKVARAAAGSLMRFPVLYAEDAEDALAMLERHGKTPYCAAMNGELKVFEASLAHDAAVIIGNEGNGADELFMQASKTLSIPMKGQTESLNAALAGAMIMYEALRQSLTDKQ